MGPSTILYAAAMISAGLPGDLGTAAPPPPSIQELRYADSKPAPDAMNYTDEAAQRLGLRDGHWEAFRPSDPLMPSVSGSIGQGGPMLKLEWH